jgi:uncharacterized Fe-S cluster protein YjdI
MKDITKYYKNDDITIVWKPSLCTHSTVCWKGESGLASVFNPMRRPWITPDAESSNRIMEQINKCPSGALSYTLNQASNQESDASEAKVESIVEEVPNGPLLVYGNITVKDKNGDEIKKNKVTAFCRCGASSNKPYCDGAHIKTGFQG